MALALDPQSAAADNLFGRTRNGNLEEVYWIYSCGPIDAEDFARVERAVTIRFAGHTSKAFAYACDNNYYVNSTGHVVHSPSCGEEHEKHTACLVCGTFELDDGRPLFGCSTEAGTRRMNAQTPSRR